jgi:C-terminal processing protease CtpA/Prc
MRLELVAPGGEVREVTVEEGEYRKSVIGAERVLDLPGRRVGYVELHSFRRGAHLAFIAAAWRLREQGIDELVLDLRMNPGGYVRETQPIASVIAGERLNGKLFKRFVYNERYRDRDVELYFSPPPGGALRLTRLFVITSKDTCSASESLINGLAPHMPVVTVGETTCGKPVGSRTLEYGEHAYTIITFRGVNARGEGDYYAGLQPTCAVTDSVTHDLGDPADPGLAAALHHIRYGSCPRPAPESWHAL